jgi:hypothetical protein
MVGVGRALGNEGSGMEPSFRHGEAVAFSARATARADDDRDGHTTKATSGFEPLYEALQASA